MLLKTKQNMYNQSYKFNIGNKKLLKGKETAFRPLRLPLA
jgi:hypothetical protein